MFLTVVFSVSSWYIFIKAATVSDGLYHLDGCSGVGSMKKPQAVTGFASHFATPISGLFVKLYAALW